MLKLKDKRFGKLVALEPLQKSKYGILWKCKCDCGSFCEVPAPHLRCGRKKSCGCVLKRENRYNWSGYKDITGFYWWGVIRNAKVRNIKIKVDKKDAWEVFEKQNRKCALTDEILTFDTKYNLHDGTASLDRIDSSKDYTIDNIQWVHKKINKMKMDMNEKELICWAEKLVNKSKKEII